MEYTLGKKVFGDWEIVEEIGEGSYGKVYQLKKENFGIVANGALKVISIPHSHADVKDALSQGMDEQSVTSYFKGVVDELMREVAVMSDMKTHPNVVGCQDYDIIPHTGGIGWDILIRMDLLTPLQEYQTRHAMDEAQVRRLGADICEALIFCQKRGLIHRDIKPGNIFVDELGRFRLGDFGVARTADKTMGGMSKQGTENYMAPEVYLGREYGPTVDIYSLGMVLYQLMNASRLPFYPLPPAPIEFSHRFEVLKKRMSGVQMPPPCNAGEDFAAIILKACAYESKDRYRTAAEFLEAIQAVAAEKAAAQPVQAKPQQVAVPEQPAVPEAVFTFDTPTGDETIGPAFTPRAPKAAPQSVQPPKPAESVFQTPVEPKPVQEAAPVFRMTVENAFDIAGRGVVVTGWVAGAAVHTGDSIMIVKKDGKQQPASVAGMEHNRKMITDAEPGTAVGILLNGLSTKEVGMGDQLVSKAAATVNSAAQQKDKAVAYVSVDSDWYETKISCLEPSGEIRTLSLPSTLGYANGKWYVGQEAEQFCGNCIAINHSSDSAREALLGRKMSVQESVGIFFEQLLQYAYQKGMGSSNGNAVTTQIDVMSMMSFVSQKDKLQFINACKKKNIGTPRLCSLAELSALRYCTAKCPVDGKYLFVHVGEQFSEATLVNWEDQVLEVLSTNYTDMFSQLALKELEKQGDSTDQAVSEAMPELIRIVESVIAGTGGICRMVLCGNLANIPAIRWQLAPLLEQEPEVMENAACTAAEGGAVMGAMMRHDPRYNGIVFLRMISVDYTIADGTGKCLLTLEAGTCMPGKVTGKFYAGQNDRELYLIEADGSLDEPAETKQVPFIGGGELELEVDLSGMVRWQVKPQADAVDRRQRTEEELRCPHCGHGSLLLLNSGFSSFLKRMVSNKNTYMCLKCKSKFEA